MDAFSIWKFSNLARVTDPDDLCRRGGARGLSHSSTQQLRREEEQSADRHGEAAAVTAAQVEASMNRKNVEVVQGDRSATLLPDDAVDALGDVGAEADDAWVPD